MDSVIKCLCGAEPIIEKKPIVDDVAIEELFKYRCPNCKEKELPWLGQWHICGALQEWNLIAPKRSYHKRTLEYNYSGVCISPPFKTYRWEDKNKPYENVTIKFYLDNSMYYYCFDYSYKKHGHGSALWISDRCYPSLEIAKKYAIKNILKSDRRLKKIIDKLLSPQQGELFI